MTLSIPCLDDDASCFGRTMESDETLEHDRERANGLRDGVVRG